MKLAFALILIAVLVASVCNDVLRWWETIQRVRRMRRRSYALTVRLIQMGVIK
ncbi:MAG: hypothetical protein OEV08_07470 [Nitrospira sp.]|nr:hypothetical protein [Nitrospira sp.]